MYLINSWKSKKKQGDKFAIKVRLGKFTLLDIYYDHAKGQFGFILLNLGVRTAPPQKYSHDKNNHNEDHSIL